MRKLVIGLLFASAVLLDRAGASAADNPPPDPVQQALGQMLAEAQLREAQALTQVHTLRAQLTSEKARADAAEARSKSADQK